jgi:ADP-heptose:LPS heptosyltransferase|tara:strand:+ start:640 stop:1101 length:462 start_codon:yes stop_codon:yes gene_type:complete
MSTEIKKAIKSAILEVLKEEKAKQLNEFNPDTGRFEDDGLSSEQKKLTSEKISKFGNYQKYIAHEAKDMDVAKDICNIVENASKYILNETDDWFDAMSVKRNLKEIKTMAKEFYKTAKERQVYTQRMQSLYEDMGNILNRYFEINGEITDEQK